MEHCLQKESKGLRIPRKVTYAIAGSSEIFTPVPNGEMNIFTVFIDHIALVLIGHILSGTGLFALLACGQVQEKT